MVAPYRIVDTPDGLFDLDPETAAGAPAPTDDEAKLADVIRNRVLWARLNPLQSRPFFPAWNAALRAFAATTVALAAGRDMVAAMVRFRQEFGDPNFQLSTDDTLKGPYVVLVDKGELLVRRNVNGVDPSDDQRNFSSELQQSERLVVALYKRGTTDRDMQKLRLGTAMERLKWAGSIALEGLKPDLKLARLALTGIVNDAKSDNGLIVRGKFLFRLFCSYLVAAVAVTVLSVVAQLLFQCLSRNINHSEAILVPWMTVLLLIVAVWSLCVGAWLSAAFRLEPDGPEVLAGIFATTLPPVVRSIYVVGFGVLAILLLHKQVVIFAFGATAGTDSIAATGFTTQLVLKSISGAVLTGGLLGLGEAALPNSVVQRSVALIAALGSK